MYQVFYIDVDEEITSIVERLKKSRTPEVYFVVPKRAFILQSMVSLKLLKRESDKFKKKIWIVTQSVQERKTIEAAGIMVKDSFEGLEPQEEIKEEMSPSIQPPSEGPVRPQPVAVPTQEKKPFRQLGSADFYEKSGSNAAVPSNKMPIDGFRDKPSVDNAVREDKFAYRSQEAVRQPGPADMTRRGPAERRDVRMAEAAELARPSQSDPKTKDLEDYFNEIGKGKRNIEKENPRPVQKASSTQGKSAKFIGAFITVVIVILAGAVGYIFLPKAEVYVTLAGKEQKESVEVVGKIAAGEVNVSGLIIPARIVEKELASDYSFEATGRGKDSGQKSRGTITIYNEFGSDLQPLVATTRFLTPDKKLFRLVRGVVVPGMTNTGGEKKAGVVEAEVVADRTGAEFDIAPSTFSIPGFEGTPKSDKFYAKSTGNFSGGGSGGGGLPNVTALDLTRSKNEAERQITESLKEEIRKSLGQGETLVEDAFEVVFGESGSQAKVGDVMEKFSYRASGKIKAFVVKSSDIENILMSRVKLNASDGPAEVRADFGKSSLDFANGSIILKIEGEIRTYPSVDEAAFLDSVVGQRDEDLSGIVKQDFPQVNGLSIVHWPNESADRLPQIKKRILLNVTPAPSS